MSRRLHEQQAKAPGARPINERVSEHVKRSGLTREGIAAATGWSEKRVQRLLSGDTDLRADDMEELARVLNLPVGALYREPGTGCAA